VLSGFILTHVYSQKGVSAGSFLRARFARIWPTHLMTCLFVLALLRPDSRQFPGTGFFDPWVVLIFNLTLTQSIVPFINYIYSWNAVAWSISTEMFFYLAFPFLLIGIQRNWPLKIGLSAVIIGIYAVALPALHIPLNSPMTKLSIFFLCYASPLFRGFEFVLGMSAYVIWTKLKDLRFGTPMELMAIALIPIWYWLNPSIPGAVILNDWLSIAGNCWIFAILICVLASSRGMVGRLLSLAPFVWLGEISFCLYMIHQIAMKWIHLRQIEGRLGPVGPVTAILICLIAATLLHYIVEKPAQRLLRGRHRYENSQAITTPNAPAEPQPIAP
jgi:peptidoglycan/LPS O-acetylase OafA/YrhL